MGVCVCHSAAKEPVPAKRTSLVPTSLVEKQLLMTRKLESAPALHLSSSAIYQRRKLDLITEDSEHETAPH